MPGMPNCSMIGCVQWYSTLCLRPVGVSAAVPRVNEGAVARGKGSRGGLCKGHATREDLTRALRRAGGAARWVRWSAPVAGRRRARGLGTQRAGVASRDPFSSKLPVPSCLAVTT